MDVVVIVTVFALLQYCWYGLEVGKMRARHGVKAPAMTGAAEFERMLRVQENTLEQLIVFLPALWIFAHWVNPLWAAGLGAIYLVGRVIYRISYLRDPKSRSLGFMLTYVPSLVMLVWVVAVIVFSHI